MASTIDNILRAAPNVPNFGAANQLAVAGGNQVVSGLDTLRQLAVEQGTINARNQQALIDRNTQAGIARLNEFKTPEEFNATDFISGLTKEFGNDIDMGAINEAVGGVPEKQLINAQAEDYFRNKEVQTKATDVFNMFVKDPGSLAGVNQLKTLDSFDAFSKENNLDPMVAQAARGMLVNKLKDELLFIPKPDKHSGKYGKGGYEIQKNNLMSGLANNLQKSISAGITTPENFVATREQMFANAVEAYKDTDFVPSYNDFIQATQNIADNMRIAYDVAADPEAKNILDTGNKQIDTQASRVQAAYDRQLLQIAQSTKNAEGNSYDPTYEFKGNSDETAISGIIPNIVSENTTNQTQAVIASQVNDVKKALVDFGLPREDVTDSMVQHIFTSTGTDTRYLGRNGYNKDMLMNIAKNVAGQVKVNKSLEGEFLKNKAQLDADRAAIDARLSETKNQFHKVLSGEYGKKNLGIGFNGYSAPDFSQVTELVAPFVSKAPDVVAADKASMAKATALKNKLNRIQELEKESKYQSTMLRMADKGLENELSKLRISRKDIADMREKHKANIEELRKLQQE